MVRKDFREGEGGGAREKGDGLTPVPEDVDEGREDGEEGPKVEGGERSVCKKHDIASKTESSSNVRGNIFSTYNYLLCSFTFMHLFVPNSDSCLGYKILHGFIARFLNDHAKELSKIFYNFHM